MQYFPSRFGSIFKIILKSVFRRRCGRLQRAFHFFFFSSLFYISPSQNFLAIRRSIWRSLLFPLVSVYISLYFKKIFTVLFPYSLFPYLVYLRPFVHTFLLFYLLKLFFRFINSIPT